MAMPIASRKYPLPKPSISVPVTELASAPSRPDRHHRAHPG